MNKPGANDYDVAIEIALLDMYLVMAKRNNHTIEQVFVGVIPTAASVEATAVGL